jgi:hypothetical protein
MGSVVGGIVGAAGNYYGAKRAADAQRDAGVRSWQSGQEARDLATFKPIGITTRFGSTNDGGYGYTASDEVKSLQDRMSGMYNQSLGQAEQALGQQGQYDQAAQGLFSLGQQYLSESPEQARQKYMQQQMDVLRPYDVEEEQRLGASVFAKGAGGLSVGQGGNPYLQTLMESRNRRNAGIASQADLAAQQQMTFGQGMLGNAANTQGYGYNLQQQSMEPWQKAFNASQGLESAAQQPLMMGSELGQVRANAGYNAGRLLLGGTDSANQGFTTAGNIKGGMLMGLGNAAGNMLGGMSMPGGSNPMQARTAGGTSYTQGSTRGPNTGGYSYY